MGPNMGVEAAMGPNMGPYGPKHDSTICSKCEAPTWAPMGPNMGPYEAKHGAVCETLSFSKVVNPYNVDSSNVPCNMLQTTFINSESVGLMVLSVRP
jgi:hypothetical protein